MLGAKPPRGGATKKKADFTTQHALIGFKHPHLSQPSALHNRTCPCPLTSDRTRNARAPTSPRSIGFCAIWESISSSSSSRCLVNQKVENAIEKHGNLKKVRSFLLIRNISTSALSISRTGFLRDAKHLSTGSGGEMLICGAPLYSTQPWQ